MGFSWFPGCFINIFGKKTGCKIGFWIKKNIDPDFPTITVT